MSPKSRLPALSKLEEILRGLQGTWRVVPLCKPESASKLAWLKAQGRDFLAPGKDQQQAAARFMRAELSFEPSANHRKLLEAAALGIRGATVLRFTAQQSVRLRPLTVAYLTRKIARGLDRRIGIATQDLVQDLAACTWRVER